MSSRTNPYDIQQIPRMPESLQIYRIGASKFWQVRLFLGRKYVRRSTRCTDKKDAVIFAKGFYDDVRIAQREGFAVVPDSFRASADFLVKRQEALMNRDERDKRLNLEDKKKLNKDILPYFAAKNVGEINTIHIEEYLEELTAERKLSASTLSKHLIVIRKVLKEAQKRGYISSLPIFPTIKRRDNPRSYFDDEEYRKLRKTARELAKKGLKVRYVPLTQEIYDFIIFHVNVFVRPSDIKLLKNKHVRVVHEKETKYLLITPPRSKTTNRDSVSMPVAVGVYERLLKRHEKQDLGSQENYVFFPEFDNREYALQTMRRQFEYILTEAELKYDSRDRTRTIYSLRHTALMFRLLKSENIDVFIEAGKLADLVVVRGNPLEDIKAARDIRFVIKDGVVHNPQSLLRSAEGRIGPKGPDDHLDWELEIKPLRMIE